MYNYHHRHNNDKAWNLRLWSICHTKSSVSDLLNVSFRVLHPKYSSPLSLNSCFHTFLYSDPQGHGPSLKSRALEVSLTMNVSIDVSLKIYLNHWNEEKCHDMTIMHVWIDSLALSLRNLTFDSNFTCVWVMWWTHALEMNSVVIVPWPVYLVHVLVLSQSSSFQSSGSPFCLKPEVNKSVTGALSLYVLLSGQCHNSSI